MLALAILGCLTFFQVLPSVAGPASEGGVAGGGGNILVCHNGRHYSYDYVMTQAMGRDVHESFKSQSSAVLILLKMLNHLQTVHPAMAVSLEDFIKSIGQSPFRSGSYNRVWIPGVSPLTRIHDESKLRQTIFCRDNQGVPRVYQAVVRQQNALGYIQYHYDQSLINSLERHSPVQLSFLYVHEWLRDYTTDPTVIMNVTRMLHEGEWVSASTDEFVNVLLRYGLILDAGERRRSHR